MQPLSASTLPSKIAKFIVAAVLLLSVRHGSCVLAEASADVAQGSSSNDVAANKVSEVPDLNRVKVDPAPHVPSVPLDLPQDSADSSQGQTEESLGRSPAEKRNMRLYKRQGGQQQQVGIKADDPPPTNQNPQVIANKDNTPPPPEAASPPQQAQPDNTLPDLTPEQLAEQLQLIQAETQRAREAFLARLTPEERQSFLEREKFLEEHKGHEKQHSQMAMILMFSLVVSQLVLMYWKKVHERSFQFVGLLGLWMVPPMIGFSAGNYRYLMVWALFSLANGWVVRKALFEVPMKSETPKLVYKWYSAVYVGSVFVGGIGYFFVVIAFFHLPYTLLGVSEKSELSLFQGGMITLFYGLYFGTLGRDFVDRLSDRMAFQMGYYNRTGFPRKHLRNNVCAICGDTVPEHLLGRARSGSNSTENNNNGYASETSSTGGSPTRTKMGGGGSSYKIRHTSAGGGIIKLGCDHTYHESCIRGWTIIGKKDCCPYCKEKVDLRAFSRHAWDTTVSCFYFK
ncbi:hypothetical protein HDV05_005415 [Chytridiales sp. JEL 0842]|nr:hypothetical protein HDV05_005415 [Chytridiales sp. JEL 0842]